MEVEIVQGDLDREEHQRDVLALTRAYAADPMGMGGPLSVRVQARLIAGLKENTNSLLLLAYGVDRSQRAAIGLATCFVGFSTFQARRLINVHDLVVLEEHRGKGVGRTLLDAVEAKARELDCCKVTLEVHENNHRAMHLYESCGFAQVGRESPLGGALFYAKPI